MRLAVCGKGGAGKTTLAATLARLFARSGRSVVTVDDDPNPNLAAALGVPEEQRKGQARLPAEWSQPADLEDGGSRPSTLDLASQHATIGPDGVALVEGTGVLGPGKG